MELAPYFADDRVTLFHGDALGEQLARLWMVAGDVLVTDPPYGIGWKRGAHLRGHPGRGHPGIAGDHDTSTRDRALELWGPDRPAIVFGSLDVPPPRGRVFTLIYRKPADAGSVGGRAGFRRDLEAVYLCGPWPLNYQGRSSLLETGARAVGGSSTGLAQRYGHPHAKPVDVLEALIGACPPGVIADPFAGSGSVLIAARNAGRFAIGAEIDAGHCATAAGRLAQMILA